MAFIDDIKSMKIRSSHGIALASLKYLKKYAGKKNLEKEAEKILRARPTGVALYNAIEELRKENTLNKINELIKRLNNSTERIAENAQSIIRNGCTIMTHCNSSSAMAVLKKAKTKKINVIATMTEPRNQGKKTVSELANHGIPATLIIDSACGFFMNKVDMVIVGADALKKEGVVNKIGTLPMSITAYEFGKPVYVSASSFKIDKRKDMEIEFRSPNEICKKINSVKILNPSFDITPWKYITGVATEEGIKKPRDIWRNF